jgi:hypothetical protein
LKSPRSVLCRSRGSGSRSRSSSFWGLAPPVPASRPPHGGGSRVSSVGARSSELEQLGDALDRAGVARGQVVAVVGEPGVGKSRLFWEFTHSHRLQGWLVLESASVSYGMAASYFPVIELLKGYFKVQQQDELRDIREKVSGKLLTLDESLKRVLRC